MHGLLFLIITFISVGYGYYKFQHSDTAIKLSIAFVVLSGLIAFAIPKLYLVSQVTDTEFWGGYVVNAEYYEDWNERVPCRHSKYETDAKGNSVYVGTEHAYDVDYHSAYWQVINSNGEIIPITSSKFQQLTQIFGNKTFVDLRRNYHTNDGDMYVTTWNNDKETLQPTVTRHFYINKIQNSTSILNYPKVDAKSENLFEYPYKSNPFDISSVRPAHKYPGTRDIDVLNALYGASRQIRIWVLVYTDQPLETAHLQEAYWKQGNKNELVICIGINKTHDVQWSHVFSWTDREDLKINIRDYVNSQDKLDLKALASFLEPEIKTNWERKEFAEFDYITIQIPASIYILTFVVVTLLSIGWIFFVHNSVNFRQKQ